MAEVVVSREQRQQALKESIRKGEINVPDLWHLAMWLKAMGKGEKADVRQFKKFAAEFSEMVLETWHLAHGLLDILTEQTEE